MTESSYTRALRRAQHDAYAPYTVRPAIRGDIVERAFEPIGRACVIVAALLVGTLLVVGVARWLLNL